MARVIDTPSRSAYTLRIRTDVFPDIGERKHFDEIASGDF